MRLLSKKAPLFQLYKKKYLPERNRLIVTGDGLKKFLKDYLFEDFKPKFLRSTENLYSEEIHKFLVISICLSDNQFFDQNVSIQLDNLILFLLLFF